jgi:hypothetical protein
MHLPNTTAVPSRMPGTVVKRRAHVDMRVERIVKPSRFAASAFTYPISGMLSYSEVG